MSPALVNCSVRAPVSPVMERLVNVASPVPLVFTTAVPPRAPPPLAIAAVTDTTDETGLPEASCSWTVGCWAKAAPFAADADGCWTITSWVAAPAVTLIALEVAAVRPALVNCRVRDPMAPVIESPEKVASPAPLVFTVVTPPSAPPPVAMATVTGTTAETALPEISRNWTVGCCAKAMAFWAVADGCWTMVSCVAAPGVRVTVPEVAVARPALVNCRVRAPTVPVMERPAKVARPFASVLMVAVPPSVPPPVAMIAVTDRTPGTALPRASRTCTVGCCARIAPFAAEAEGCCTIPVGWRRPACRWPRR